MAIIKGSLFDFLYKSGTLVYSLELPHWSNSNEYTIYIFMIK